MRVTAWGVTAYSHEPRLTSYQPRRGRVHFHALAFDVDVPYFVSRGLLDRAAYRWRACADKLACGAAGHRVAAPSARIMIHQPVRSSGGGSSNSRQLSISAASIEKSRLRLTELLALRTLGRRALRRCCAASSPSGADDAVVADGSMLGVAALLLSLFAAFQSNHPPPFAVPSFLLALSRSVDCSQCPRGVGYARRRCDLWIGGI